MQRHIATLGSAFIGIVLLAGCSAGGSSSSADPVRTFLSAPAASEPPASPTSVPSPTPQPVLSSPLTGRAVDGREVIARRPLLVKVGNSEAERPQSGLSQADVVYESVTEGGITRYAAVFQSRDATNLGPIRSARLSDLQIAPEFSAVLAHVGASSPIMTMLRGGSVLDLDQFLWQQYYHRTADRVPPYNVYTSTVTLRQGAGARGFSPDARVPGYAFEDVPAVAGADETIEFDFAPETHVQYVYNPTTHAYKQIEYGKPTTDASTKEPVPITNLVVQFVAMTPTSIVEDGNGTHSLDYELTGSGKVAIFHDGRRLDGIWKRPTAADRTSFVDMDGEPIPLARGSVWIALVAPNTAITVHGAALLPAAA